MSFSQDISKFGVGAVDKIQRVRRGVTLKLMTSVIMDTPVLTGRLRANWRLSAQQPNFNERVGFDASRQEAAAAKGTTIPNHTQAAINEVQEGIEASTGDGLLFLTNNLPYAHRIEFDGWSKKSPEGMVRRNVVRFGRLIKVYVGEK